MTIYSLLPHKMKALFFFSVDPSIGKIDKFSLSQQTLMELFIENITNKENVSASGDNPIAEWKHLTFDFEKDIISIFWSYQSLVGSIALRWLPLSTKKVFLSHNFLSGTSDLTCLPDSLVALILSNNNLEGSVDLRMLPEGLQKLILRKNNFSGKTNFSQLPKSLVFLNVTDTQLEGTICDFNGTVILDDSNVIDMRNR